MRNGYPGRMARLPLSVHPIPGETATSLASRLAQVNHVSLREFLRDMGVGIHSLIAGERAVLTQLAELSGVPVAALRQGTPRTSDGETWFAGHRFPDARVGGKEVRGCPDCLEADPGLRGIWSLPFVTICAEHNRPLMRLWTVQDRLDRHDVTRRLPEIDLSPEARPEQRDPSRFEAWLLNRLAGDTGQDHWLDQFDLHASTQFCFEFGRAAIATKLPKWRSLRDDQQWWPTEFGFRLCSGGEEPLRAALIDLQHLMGKPENGPRKIFGGLHDLLAVDPCPEELQPFQDILQRHIFDTWPLAPGDEMLGEPVLRRGRMSLLSVASLLQLPEADIHTAMKVDDRSPSGWTLIDRAEARAAFPEGLIEPDFLQAMSLRPDQFAQARDVGLFERTDDLRWNAWAAQDLIDDLLLGAEPIYVAMHDWCSLGEASSRLQMTFSEIIEDVSSGRLARVGKYLQRSGFASVLVNLGHVGQEGEATSLDAVAYSQGLRPSELLTFVRRNGLSCQQVRGPRGGARFRMGATDRETFHDRFISFRTLGVIARLGWSELQARLDADGIRPTGGSARIYSRADVTHLVT